MKIQTSTNLSVLLIVLVLIGGAAFDKYLNSNQKTIENVNLTNEITGTYVSINNPGCSITIDQQENSNDKIFYLFDYDNDLFVKGTVTKESNEKYLLLSKKLNNQAIVCKNLMFDIMIDGNELTFQKMIEVPTIPYNLDEYNFLD